MTFNKNDRVRVAGEGHWMSGRCATVLGYDSRGRVRIKVNVKLPEVSPDWEHDYWAVEESVLELTDSVTELGEITREAS